MGGKFAKDKKFTPPSTKLVVSCKVIIIANEVVTNEMLRFFGVNSSKVTSIGNHQLTY